MSYEYTVNIPAGKRAAFRKFVASLGGSVSRGRKTDAGDVTNATTLAAMREVESGVELEPFDYEAFHAYAQSL